MEGAGPAVKRQWSGDVSPRLVEESTPVAVRASGDRGERLARPGEPSGDGTSPPLTVVVLAAGTGRRINSGSSGGPKWLLPIGEQRIADLQLHAVEQSAASVSRVVVVTGHQQAEINAYLAVRASGLSCTTVNNPLYDVRNNWFSLAIGLRDLAADETVVIINSDLVTGDRILERFLQSAASMRCEVLLAVDDDRPLTREAMKVAARSLPSGDLALTGIGKTGVTDPIGEYIGIAAVRPSAVPKLMDVLAAHELDVSRHDRWYDLAFADLAAAGVDVRLWSTGSSCWVEVDDQADLEAAQGLATRGIPE